MSSRFSFRQSRAVPAVALVASVLLSSELPAAVPSGFVDEFVVGGFNGAAGITFDANDRMYVWERGGRVHIVENGVRLPTPLIDISDEVGNWRDFGLLGFTLDPDYLTNGRFYLYYVVDRHHLLHHGTPSYNPSTNQYFAATIGRITRYSADPSTGFSTTLPGSRQVLLGETASTGVPILHQSHGTGALIFGEDGTLLASSGDGASYTGTDTGSFSGTYWSQALSDGIIRNAENVGAFRSQMLGSHNGKLLRLDPDTGDGVPSNPFFDAAAPRSPRSRTWALGLRNPFRFSVRPGTGNPDPAAADPGDLYIGDVGYGTWEDLHVVDEPGLNLGWPIFEGLTPHGSYSAALTDNRDAPNPLGCGFFDFQDLIRQQQADHNPAFPNPCNPAQSIPPGTPTFMHYRPAVEWRHGSATPRTRVPTYSGNTATVAVLGSPQSGASGTPFNGNAAVGGFWHSGAGLPSPWAGSYFCADYAQDWIRSFHFDEHHLESVEDFATIDAPVFLAEDPADGSVLFIPLFSGQVRRARYLGTVDRPPVAVLDLDIDHGTSPLTVHFDASSSYDPEGGLLTFAWQFGDGGSSTKPSPRRVYSSGGGGPLTRTVTLTLTDTGGLQTTVTRDVHIDNSPPLVDITSPVDGSYYWNQASTTYDLIAAVSDAEHSPGELDYAWQVFLHHGSHSHPEPIDTSISTTAQISPTPCSGEFYAYRIHLTVTDANGLAGHDDVWLFPDCNTSASVTLAPLDDSSGVQGRPVSLTAIPSGSYESVTFYAGEERIGTRTTAPFSVDWTPSRIGPVTFSVYVEATDGSSAHSTGQPYDVLAPDVEQIQLSNSTDDAEETLSSGRMRLSSSDLEMARDGSRDQLVGMRFPVSLPAGVFVTAAWIQFHVDEIDSGATRLIIEGEASGQPAAFSGTDGDLTSRTPTNAFATWDPQPWSYIHAAGARQRSPDIAPIIQELVDRGDWQSPSHVVLLVSGSGARVAESADGTSGFAPELVIEYDGDVSGGINQPPSVDAGPDRTVTLPATALEGSASDDGRPGPLISAWSQVSGPGTVSFQDAGDPQSAVTFPSVGTYVLRLTADDGELSASDDVTLTVTDAPIAGNTLYLSNGQNGMVGLVKFKDEDILAYDLTTSSWSIYFDGSDVGLGSSGYDVDAFAVEADGSVLLSLTSAKTFPDVGSVDDSDIVRFVPTSTGSDTAGVFETWFRGADVGLSSSGEDVDAFAVLPDGRLLISTSGSISAPGFSARDEDLALFTPTSLGSTTAGTWSLWFDGSDVGLTSSDEDLRGVSVDANGDLLLSTRGAFTVPGLSGAGEDVFRFVPTSLGTTTAGTFEMFFDGSDRGFPGSVYGVSIAP